MQGGGLLRGAALCRGVARAAGGGLGRAGRTWGWALCDWGRWRVGCAHAHAGRRGDGAHRARRGCPVGVWAARGARPGARGGGGTHIACLVGGAWPHGGDRLRLEGRPRREPAGGRLRLLRGGPSDRCLGLAPLPHLGAAGVGASRDGALASCAGRPARIGDRRLRRLLRGACLRREVLGHVACGNGIVGPGQEVACPLVGMRGLVPHVPNHALLRGRRRLHALRRLRGGHLGVRAVCVLCPRCRLSRPPAARRPEAPAAPRRLAGAFGALGRRRDARGAARDHAHHGAALREAVARGAPREPRAGPALHALAGIGARGEPGLARPRARGACRLGWGACQPADVHGGACSRAGAARIGRRLLGRGVALGRRRGARRRAPRHLAQPQPPARARAGRRARRRMHRAPRALEVFRPGAHLRARRRARRRHPRAGRRGRDSGGCRAGRRRRLGARAGARLASRRCRRHPPARRPLRRHRASPGRRGRGPGGHGRRGGRRRPPRARRCHPEAHGHGAARGRLPQPDRRRRVHARGRVPHRPHRRLRERRLARDDGLLRLLRQDPHGASHRRRRERRDGGPPWARRGGRRGPPQGGPPWLGGLHHRRAGRGARPGAERGERGGGQRVRSPHEGVPGGARGRRLGVPMHHLVRHGGGAPCRRRHMAPLRAGAAKSAWRRIATDADDVACPRAPAV